MRPKRVAVSLCLPAFWSSFLRGYKPQAHEPGPLTPTSRLHPRACPSFCTCAGPEQNWVNCSATGSSAAVAGAAAIPQLVKVPVTPEQLADPIFALALEAAMEDDDGEGVLPQQVWPGPGSTLLGAARASSAAGMAPRAPALGVAAEQAACMHVPTPATRSLPASRPPPLRPSFLEPLRGRSAGLPASPRVALWLHSCTAMARATGGWAPSWHCRALWQCTCWGYAVYAVLS